MAMPASSAAAITSLSLWWFFIERRQRFSIRRGVVVGATYPDEARQLREIMPQQIFLVPGYGAQGATAADCAASFKADGTGAIVNASRSVIYAFSKENADADWKTAIKSAAQAFAADIAGALSK